MVVVFRWFISIGVSKVTKMGTIFKRFVRDTSGHFAIWTGILAFPLLGATTFVIDYNMAEQRRASLKGALDAAALAAVSDQTLTQRERALYAENHFNMNFEHAADFKFAADSPGPDRLNLTANGTSPVSVVAAFGIKEIKMEEQSSAIITREHVICVLTLNPSGGESFSLFRGAVFNSPKCAVQVNSTSPEAAYVDGSSIAIAKDFCISGGVVGNFQPFANTQCAPVADPYANKKAPSSGPCINLDAFRGKGKNSPPVIRDGATLTPGTYCESLTIAGTDVTFDPGTYIFDGGEIWFRAGSQAEAKGVTLVLKGVDSKIFVEKESTFYIKAPIAGEFAGLAIFQDAASVQGARHFPTGASELTGGSQMTIVGTVYLPTQKIEIWGNSQFSSTSPATSYIGYDVAMGKQSQLTVNVDHESAGLPPILPRTDEGARLIE